MEPFDRAWFSCCPSGRIPSDEYGIPTCSSNDVTRSTVGLTQAANHWKQMRTHAQNRNNACLLKSPEHRWVQEMLDLYSHSTRAPWFGHFCPTGNVSSMFWLMFSWSDGRVKINHKPKRTYTDTRLSKYIMETVYISKTYFEYMVQCEFHDVMAHITACVSNVKWAQNMFS